jgi:amino acid transporter
VRIFRSRAVLLFAFAFAVMADPVSSVAYAVEAALRALNGDLALLVPTMLLVVAIIGLVVVNYRAIITRYPQGGGASAAVGEAFGDAWSFVPIGALVVDFVLTIAISVSAGTSAIIAYLPEWAPWRVAIALALVVIVAGLTWFGNLGRVLFAMMTISFVAVAVAVLSFGAAAEPFSGAITTAPPSSGPVLGVLLAFPVAMALATGIEAPSTAIAQLGELDDRGRARFGRITLWLTLGIVGSITIGLAVQAAALQIGVPREGSTLIAELARHVAPEWLFATFQLVTTLLLLAAASSSFQAGPGLLKALAEHRGAEGEEGILPRAFGVTNRSFTPYWGVVMFAVLAMTIVALAGARDQFLVLFYAVAVFVSFLAGLVSMARFSWRARQYKRFALNVFGSAVVVFTLVANLARGWPLVSLAVAVAISLVLWMLWVRAGRPEGVRSLEVRPG